MVRNGPFCLGLPKWPLASCVSPPDHDRKLHGPQVTPCQKFLFQNSHGFKDFLTDLIGSYDFSLWRLHHSVDIVRNLAAAAAEVPILRTFLKVGGGLILPWKWTATDLAAVHRNIWQLGQVLPSALQRRFRL